MHDVFTLKFNNATTKANTMKSAKQLAAENPQAAAVIAAKFKPLLTCRITGSDAGSCAPMQCDTLNQASAAYRAFIKENFFGASEAGTCRIYANGRQVAYVSYNGKVWSGTHYQPDAKPLYDPSENLQPA